MEPNQRIKVALCVTVVLGWPSIAHNLEKSDTEKLIKTSVGEDRASKGYRNKNEVESNIYRNEEYGFEIEYSSSCFFKEFDGSYWDKQKKELLRETETDPGRAGFLHLSLEDYLLEGRRNNVPINVRNTLDYEFAVRFFRAHPDEDPNNYFSYNHEFGMEIKKCRLADEIRDIKATLRTCVFFQRDEMIGKNNFQIFEWKKCYAGQSSQSSTETLTEAVTVHKGLLFASGIIECGTETECEKSSKDLREFLSTLRFIK